MLRPILSNCKPKTARIMNREEDDRLVLYSGHRLFVLGNHAVEVWHLCDGTHTLDDIIKITVDKYNLPQERTEQKITEFINQLLEKKLIVLE